MTPPARTQNPVVAVIGLGYIGLPTAAILATHGAEVIGVDVNEATVDAVNRGEVPFVEPDLEISVAGAVSQGRLRAAITTPEAEVYVVAVPTPFGEDHEADLSFIDAAADGIAPRLRGDELIILESTSPPGATQHLADRILAVRPDLSLDGSDDRPIVHVAHCPERVLPGRVMVELVTNDRIVGGLTFEAAVRAKALYATFCKGEILVTGARTAELAKLVENAYRDVNIAFANELSVICDRLDVDVWELIELANHHPRVNILKPGPGVGGHCIAVDPWFIVAAAPEQARLVRTAREVNDAKPAQVAKSVVNAVTAAGARRVAMLGLSYKPDIDDLRSSPAITVVKHVAARMPDLMIEILEPNVSALPTELSGLPNVVLRESLDLSSFEVVVLLVDHAEFKTMRPSGTTIIDTRGAWRAAV